VSDDKRKANFEWLEALKTMLQREYWTKANTVEFIAFMVKIIIIFPGLVFNVQWWWLYVLALFTSFALIWSSTVKTLPTLIILNIAWVAISVLSILKGLGLIL
jgi:hypothetical protein